jgi:hypothetical protein
MIIVSLTVATIARSSSYQQQTNVVINTSMTSMNTSITINIDSGTIFLESMAVFITIVKFDLIVI